jgi:hypothetical protein
MAGDTAGLGVKLLEGASAGADVAATYTRSRATRGQALYNAAMADLEAQDTRNVGNSKAARVEGQYARVGAKSKTQIAGRGFNTGAGTANDIADATDFIGRLDALTIRQNTERAVISRRAESGSYRMTADSINPGVEATGTLIGEAGLLSRRWQRE